MIRLMVTPTAQDLDRLSDLIKDLREAEVSDLHLKVRGQWVVYTLSDIRVER